MGIKFSFAQVSSILESVHRIAPVHSSAFRARLKHLQRLGFPSGINTGKGKAAAYGFRELMMLAVALQLIEIGMSPEKATGICQANESDIVRYTVKAINLANSDKKMEYFLVVHHSSLENLRAEREEDQHDDYRQSAIVIGHTELSRLLANKLSPFERLSIVSLHVLILSIYGGATKEGLNIGESIADSIVELINHDQHPQT
ncbi:hypothetical protein [Sphingobium bisphenolivorans]|uniref:hypothetical protein n=1 Tax=Sphingobium bisphenolivorans TaxID=1335760 RepID=UPI0003B67BE3|nr:hypothetical protein [Sphingobium bisphenolivorans]